MESNVMSFSELAEAVINQLKSEKYLDSTVINYRRTYNRIHVFLQQSGTDEYTHELGKSYLSNLKVSASTFSSCACAVRRLDDYIDGKPYRAHHDNYREQVPSAFSDALEGYLKECGNIGNKPATIQAKEKICISFLCFLDKSGCKELSLLSTDLVSLALLNVSNKDNYARIRQFLKYLADNGLTSTDLSGIVPRHKRGMIIPTTYEPHEILKVENSINVSTATGKRNLAIVRLASRMGLRAGDIVKLRMSEIDFVTGNISIIQEKTGLPLTLQMPPEVSAALLAHVENDAFSSQDGFTFHEMVAPYGCISTTAIGHVLRECFRIAGINTNGKKHGPHSFRSSLASSMVNDGISYEVVRRILGHSDPDVIKHYAKSDIENLRRCSIEPPVATGRFNDYLSGREVISHV